MTVDNALKKYSEHYQFLNVPGIADSGETHWQTNWENSFPEIKRVIQKDWVRPDREVWLKNLESSIQKNNEKSIILISHSLGGGTIIHADYLNKLNGVKGIFMVALPDIEREDFPKECSGFVPMPRRKLSIPGVMVSSENDEWCTIEVAEKWSASLVIPLINIGKKQHICGAEEFETWEEGKKLLVKFLDSLDN
jgi:predicted alpha/beta hydrolase family esterase